ncbi:MAG: 4Fe-4S binding protein [Candidatus Bathyarchaeia archaeon]
MNESEPRIGVYVCHCGANIAGVVDVEAVINSVKGLPGVVTAKHYVYMCSQPGQALIKEDISKLNLNRVIVASCSPIMHEPTYRKVLEEAGLNPFFFEMANIREQVSWAHMREAQKATEKAKDLIRMAVGRARLLEPVSKMEVKVTRRALVIGAGVAGITAALDIARGGFEVYLVEKEPYVGGHLALLNQLYWGKQASQILSLLTQGLTHPNIKLLVNSTVEEVDGYIGNFNVKIVQEPRFVNQNCDACGKCEKVCDVSIPNKTNFGLDQRKAIYLMPNSYPPIYVIDREACNRCGKCVKICEKKAINLDEKTAKINVDVGMIIVATGFEPYMPTGEFGYGKYKDVITQLTLERILSESGPTKGKIVRPSNNKTPDSVTFILCVGSRQGIKASKSDEQANEYCSRSCCASALKNALILKENHPEIDVYIIFRDIRTFGRGHEEIYRKCRELGITFVRYKAENPPEVTKTGSKLVVKVRDSLFKVEMEIFTDMVVLVEGMVPRGDIDDLRAKLGLTLSPDGFFQEAHPKMNPLNTFTDGIFLGGAAQGPKDVIDTLSQASGAAAKATILLQSGRVLVDLVTAIVDENICTGCGKCIDVCPYKAIETDVVKDIVKVIEVKCKGCGSCSATCPVGAMQVRHFKDAQILAMVENLVPS